MLALILMFLGLEAFSQVSYFTGKRTDTFPEGKFELPMAGIMTLDKTSRTWLFTRCDPENNCVRYSYKLYKDKDEKYYLEKPGIPGYLSVSPAKVEDDHINLRKFFVTNKNSDGSSFQMEHLTLGQNTMWKAFGKDQAGVITEMKTVLEPASKEDYDKFLKGKKVEVLQLKKPD